MYTAYFGLEEPPFRLTPDVDYMFMSRGHQRAKAYIDYALVSKDGFVVITGDIGSGKTMLLRKVLSEDHDSTVLVHIDQTQLTSVEFLQFILQDLTGEAGSGNKVELLQRLKKCLEEADMQGLRVVVCVDEAQVLSREVLEELRLLSALEARKDALISIILMGQPELWTLLETPEQEQLRQRVRLHLHLKGLEPDEARAYVLHRLSVAGSGNPEELLSNDAWDAIYKYTGGVPRLINVLCDMAFLRAFVQQKKQVDAEVVVAAAQERDLQTYAERQASVGAPRVVDTQPRATTRKGTDGDAELGKMLKRLDGRLQGIEESLKRIADSMDPQVKPTSRKRGVS